MGRSSVALLSALTAACSLPEVSLEGRPCPCPDGGVCSLEGVCVERPDGSVPRRTDCDGELGRALVCDGFEDPGRLSLVQVAAAGSIGELSPGRVGRNAGFTCGRPSAGPSTAAFVAFLPGPPFGPRVALFWRAWLFLSPERPGDVEILRFGDLEGQDDHIGLAVSAFGQLLLRRGVAGSGVEVGEQSPPDLVPSGAWVCLQAVLGLSAEGEAAVVSAQVDDAFVPLLGWQAARATDLTFEDGMTVSMGVFAERLPEQVCAVFDEVALSITELPTCE
ncbi:MAG: hypothetical protein ACFCGT_00130 [Sandaracinaceae bacterium]